MEEEGGFGPIVEKMETKLKLKPKFGGSFLVIMKVETTRTRYDNNDVIDDKQTRTMYRKVPDIAGLGKISAELKKEARDNTLIGITTKFSIVSCFAQDETGQIVDVEKYGAYGHQEWKVGHGE